MGARGKGFFEDTNLFVDQHSTIVSQFVLDELKEVTTNENLDRTDALLLVIQGIYPVAPPDESAVGLGLQRLIDALIMRGGEDPIRGWLLHQAVDILFHIGGLTVGLGNTEQINLARTLSRIADVKYETAEYGPHHYFAAYKAVSVLEYLRVREEVMCILKEKFEDHFDKRVAVDALEAIDRYSER